MSFDLFSKQCFEPVATGPLPWLDNVVRWDKLREIGKGCTPERGVSTLGRPAYSDEQLLRLAVLRLVFQCSGPAAAEALRCRLDWRQFCRFGLTEPLPEVSTLNRHYRALADGDGLHRILAQVRADVIRHGRKLIPSRGAPVPQPKFAQGADGGMWEIEGKTAASPYETTARVLPAGDAQG